MLFEDGPHRVDGQRLHPAAALAFHRNRAEHRVVDGFFGGLDGGLEKWREIVVGYAAPGIAVGREGDDEITAPVAAG